MTVVVKKVSLEEHSLINNTEKLNLPYAEALANLTVECHVRIGTLRLTVKELQQLQANAPVTLEQKTNEPVDILLNNQIIARGELLCIDEHFAVKITEIST